MSKRQGTKDKDEDLEEMFRLRPAEVTLTGAPAVREEFLMTKSTVKLNDLELHGLASKLGVDGIEAIPEAEVSKAIALKSEELKAEDDDKEDDEDEDKEGGKKNPIPPQFRKNEDMDDKDKDKDKKEDDEDDKELDLGKSAVMRSLAPTILTASKADLPANVVKALEKIVAEDEKSDNDDTDAAKAVAEVMKSEMPGIVNAISAPYEKRLAQLEGERDAAAMHEIAKSIPGDTGKMTKRLVILKKSMPKADFDEFVAEQVGLQKSIDESELMSTIQGRAVNASEPEQTIQSKAEAIVSKAGKTGDPIALAKAIETVMDLEPALANQYNNDMQARAGKGNHETV